MGTKACVPSKFFELGLIFLLEAIPQPDRFTSSLIRFTYFGEIMRGLLIKLTLFIGSCD